MSHKPVLLKEAIEVLEPRPGEFFIDGTIGGGGHAVEMLRRISPNGILLGIDWDEKAILNLKSKILNPNLILVHGNYADLPEILSAEGGSASGGKKKKLGRADGLLLDLGFSSEQLEAGRGFSFHPAAAGEPLLMTYDASRKPVKKILRELRENELADIIFRFGGERFSRRIARAIKERERAKPIETSGELREVVEKAVPKNYELARRRRGVSPIEPATRTFQALRIYANDELGNLEKVLKRLPEILKPAGRVAIISFHSLEDRLVKESFKGLERQKALKILTKKPIKPTFEEIKQNPRSHSAKLRAAIIN